MRKRINGFGMWGLFVIDDNLIIAIRTNRGAHIYEIFQFLLLILFEITDNKKYLNAFNELNFDKQIN